MEAGRAFAMEAFLGAFASGMDHDENLHILGRFQSDLLRHREALKEVRGGEAPICKAWRKMRTCRSS